MGFLKENVIAVLLAGCVLGQAGAPARGQSSDKPTTLLQVQIGWGDKVRTGRWTPIFIQATDPKTQAAVIEINAPQGGLYAMQVRQYFTLGPLPSTYTLFVPLQANWGQGPSVVIRGEHGKMLARYPEDAENDSFYLRAVNGNAHFIGVSGQPTTLQMMQGQVVGDPLEAAYLDPELLPASPIGYDSLDMLVLNEPDLLKLRGEQQQAIVDWVRGGGNLMLWPGEDPAPRSGPLIDALPCMIGGIGGATLSEADRARLGLPKRFSGIRGRTLVPRADAARGEPVDVFGTNVPENLAYRRRLGLGSILVAPVNLSELQFDPGDHANQFWQPLLAGTSAVRNPREDNTTSYNNVDPFMRRQYGATQILEDFLGNVPGAGKFGFSYVAMVLLGMMVIVGPVDWFVLRKLGRQPWTWVTTTAWIILVTGGALFIGHVFKSGKLHYGSVRVIDQAGGETVGETALTGIYSPRTTYYHLDASPGSDASPTGNTGGASAAATRLPPPGWWSVAGTEEYGSRHGSANDISFHQTDEGNGPEEMLINVWNLRFLREETTSGGPPLVEATLAMNGHWTYGDHPLRLVGVIKNLTDKPLLNVHIRTHAGVAPQIDRIEPAGSVKVDTYIDAAQAGLFSEANSELSANWRYPYSNNGGAVVPVANLWHVAGFLSASRSRRIEAMLTTERFACIYADCPGSAPPAALREAADGSGEQQHYQLLRALVPLTPAGIPMREEPSHENP